MQSEGVRTDQKVDFYREYIMFAKSVENKAFYLNKIGCSNFETPYASVLDMIKGESRDIIHYFDDIYLINNLTVLNGNCLSSSLITSGLLALNNVDNKISNNNRYSIYSNIKIPYFLRKNFYRNNKMHAIVFCNALLKKGKTVTLTPHDFSSESLISGISTEQEFEIAWDKLSKGNRYLVVESDPVGDPFRVFIKGKVILAVYGIVAPFVIGDGISTLRDLIEIFKDNRRKNILYKDNPLVGINKGLDMNFIPFEGEIIKLKESLCIETGGMYIDLTDELKDKLEYLAIHISELLIDELYLEITCFSKNIKECLKDNSFKVGYFKQNSADLRHLFTCITDTDGMRKAFSKIFPIAPKERENSFDKPEVYSNKHFQYTSQQYTLVEAAYQLGLKVEILDRNLFRVTDEEHHKSVLFMRGISQYAPAISKKITTNKFLTKKILEKANINTPKGYCFNINEVDIAWRKVEKFCEKGRVVIKPLDREGGRGVSTDISTRSQFIRAWQICNELDSKNVLVEEQLKGDDYRVVVVKNSICGVSQRVSARVVGDGVHNIQELIELKNITRRKNIFLKDSPILVTDSVLDFLEKRGLSLSIIPANGDIILLSGVANAGVGGDIIDRTDDMHPDWVAIAVKVRKLLINAYHLGLDIMMEDIAKSPMEQEWAVIEVNTNPDFGVQLFPGQGVSRNIGKVFLEQMFSPSFHRNVYKLTFFEVKKNSDFQNWLKTVCDYHSVVGYVKSQKNEDISEAIFIGAKSNLDQVVRVLYKNAVPKKIASISLVQCDDDFSYEKYVAFSINS